MGKFSFYRILKISKRLYSKNNPAINPVMKYLNVAEKNDAAKNIAAILSRGSSSRREGFSVYNKIYEFDATLFNDPVRMIMTSVSGHLHNYAFSSNFKNWRSCNPVALFEAPISKVCTDEAQAIKRTLEREVKYCAGLIIWTDCDREGENIGFEIIKVCTDIKPNLIIYRAKFSEITAASIHRALATLGRPNKNVSDAVDVRQELDLRTGAAFTRLQTMRLQQVFPQKLADRLISYGSCQFPTLGFVVERYQQIEAFIPEKFWKIKMNHRVNNFTTEFLWERDRLFDRNACLAILDIMQENKRAKIVSVEKKQKSKYRPVPLDTVEMEKIISRKLKINAKETMRIAEKLYSQGFISYPRTETNIFPKELNLTNLVEQQRNDANWGAFAQRILSEGGPQPRQGKKSDKAHPPIHPTKYADGLSGNEKRVYEYIVRHFLACVQKDAKGFETIVKANVADEIFTAKGLIILEKNYLDVYVYEKWNAKEINDYQQNDEFEPTVLDVAEGETSAPKLLTESELIALMDKHGIGTDATHAEHIETIKSREYVGLHDNLYFVPGNLGMGLVEGYNNIGLEVSLAKPILRSEFEKDLQLICDGAKNAEVVRTEQIRKYKQVFETVMQKMGEIDRTLANRLDDTPRDVAEPEVFEPNRPVFKCPKCGNDMVVKDKRTGSGKFLSCCGFPECRNAIWLPENVETLEVLDESCSRCRNGAKKVRIKFRQNLFPGEPNPNVFCLGGCDPALLEALDVRMSQVRRTSNGNIAQSVVSNEREVRNESRRNIERNQTINRTVNQNVTLNVVPPPTNATFSNRSTNSNPEDEITCSCNLAALKLTVRKEGPNKGRQFYKCSTSTCNFFLWATPSEPNNDANVTTTQGNDGVIKCNCDEPAARRVVAKEGPNKGRVFYCCAKPMGQGCKFYKWGDEEDTGSGWGGGPGGGGGPRRGGGRGRGRGGGNSGGEDKPRAKRKCGKCGVEGHTRNKCPS